MKAVSVACRIRPLQQSEEAGSIVVDEATVSVDSSQGVRSFSFDHAFGPNAEDDFIWDQLKLNEMTHKVLEGYHSTVMAYGQTGSGKTYTIDGGSSDNGVVSRSARALFDQMQEKEGQYTLRVSYLQLYLEKTFDLLNPAPWLIKTSSDKKRVEHLQKQPGLRIRRGINGWYVENLYATECANAKEVMDHWKFGRESKMMAQTALNAHSSRSHSMFVIEVEKNDPDNFSYRCVSKLSIVDLAGSEKPNGDASSRFQESININGSLFVLRKVVTALVQGAKHIPYRESKLTCLLQQSIGGSSYLVLLACINPTLQTTDESISTLHYAAQTSHIQNAPNANKDPRLELIAELRGEIAYLQSYIVDTLEQPLPPNTDLKLLRRRRTTSTSLDPSKLRIKGSDSKFDAYKPDAQTPSPQGVLGPSPNTTDTNRNLSPRKFSDSHHADQPRALERRSEPPIKPEDSNVAKCRAFLEKADKTFADPPRRTVRALARWFHEQRKIEIFGSKARKSSTNEHREPSKTFAQEGKDHKFPNKLNSDIDSRASTKASCGDDSRSSTKTSSRTPSRAETPLNQRALPDLPGKHSPRASSPVMGLLPSKPSTPPNLRDVPDFGSSRPRKASSHSRPLEFSTRPSLSNSLPHQAPDTNCGSGEMNDYDDAEQPTGLLREESFALEERIADLEKCNNDLRRTTKDLEDSSLAQKEVDGNSIAKLEIALQEATERARAAEESCEAKVEELKRERNERQTQVIQSTRDSESQSQRLDALEVLAVSNLRNVAINQSNGSEDIKSVLRSVLSEFVEKRYLNAAQAKELREEVAVLKKKKGLMLSIMGKAEACQIQEEIKQSRRAKTVHGLSDHWRDIV